MYVINYKEIIIAVCLTTLKNDFMSHVRKNSFLILQCFASLKPSQQPKIGFLFSLFLNYEYYTSVPIYTFSKCYRRCNQAPQMFHFDFSVFRSAFAFTFTCMLQLGAAISAYNLTNIVTD